MSFMLLIFFSWMRNERVFHDGFHPFGVGDEVGGE